MNLPLNQQKSTSSVVEFSTVETMPLFDVFFGGGGGGGRGYIASLFLISNCMQLYNSGDCRGKSVPPCEVRFDTVKVKLMLFNIVEKR